jgi:EAL domain-containing protein (putative c-di-GMP-specific phosphodiesterase class I)
MIEEMSEHDLDQPGVVAQATTGDVDRRARQDRRRRDDVTARRVQAVLDTGGPQMVRQPIVRLTTGAVVGYEALARFQGHPDSSPITWFDDAARAGMSMELELAAVRGGIEHIAGLPEGTFISVNVSPEAASSRDLEQLLDAVPIDRVVLEITEHDDIDSYQSLNRALLGMRIKGLQLAIDDAGAGYASFRHILHLQPDLIKLDASWVVDIEADALRRALITALVGFANDLDAIIVGEAVETEAQARVLLELGVTCAQGYFFGRPEAPG